MQKSLEGDDSGIPFKQRSITPLSLDEYQQQSSMRGNNNKAYNSGDYTMKQIGEYFKVHYSLVSRIVAASKK
jgi:putative transposase